MAKFGQIGSEMPNPFQSFSSKFGKTKEMPEPEPMKFEAEPVRTMTVKTQAPTSQQQKAVSWYQSDQNIAPLVEAMMERTYG